MTVSFTRRLDIFQIGLDILKVVQRLQLRILAPEDVSLDPPRQPRTSLILPETPERDGKDVVEHFEGALLSLRDEEEDHDERADVHAGIEAERAGGCHGGEHAWEGDAKNGGPEQASGHGPAHADFSVRERENLCAVGKRDRTFSRGVKCGEEEDEEGDQAEMRSVFLGDVKAEAGGKRGPGHLGECEQEQCAAAEGVNGEECWPGKDEVDEAKAERRQERFQL